MQKFGTVPPVGIPPEPQAIPTNPDCPLMRPVTSADVLAAFRKLGTAKAPGADGIPAEFITKAYTEDCGYVLVDVITDMCNTVLQLGYMPESWKHKALSPLHKTGPRDDPANYRPIAVATTLYRIFTAVFATRLTEYMQAECPPARLLDSQFAFRKQLSTQHAHMVLATCCDTALARRQPLALVKLDISKAYDTVDREALWLTLAEDGFPPAFVQLMQEVYRDTPYVVRVNGELSDTFLTDQGVLQGCALSPACYNKYLRSCLEAVEQRCRHMGIMLGCDQDGEAVAQCVQVDFADDIHGTVVVQHVAGFIAVVEQELARKHQTLNIGKCRVLVVHHSEWPDTHIAGIPVVQQLKILGLQYTKAGCVVKQNVMEQARKGTTKAVLHMARLYACGCQHDVRIASLMLKADVQATMLFGASIWGAHSLAYADPVKYALQKPCNMFLRRALRQPHSTANWVVILLTGSLPIQHWVIRDFVRFWNRMLLLQASNTLVKACAIQQVQLSQSNKRSWLWRWRVALHKLLPGLDIPTKLHDMQPIAEQDVVRAMVASYTALLNAKGDPFSLAPLRNGRRIALVWHMLKGHYVWGHTPQLVRLPADGSTRWAWLRTLAGNAQVPVHDHVLLRGRHVPFAQRLCPKCAQETVGDELHVLLHCPATQAIRHDFADCLQWRDCLPEFFVANMCGDLPSFVHTAMMAYTHAPVVHPDEMPLRQLALQLRSRVQRD
jgi:hypothetical protein